MHLNLTLLFCVNLCQLEDQYNSAHTCHKTKYQYGFWTGLSHTWMDRKWTFAPHFGQGNVGYQTNGRGRGLGASGGQLLQVPESLPSHCAGSSNEKTKPWWVKIARHTVYILCFCVFHISQILLNENLFMCLGNVYL